MYSPPLDDYTKAFERRRERFFVRVRDCRVLR